MDAISIAALIVLILAYIICVASLPSLLFLRNVQPIKARSMTLLVAVLICIIIDQTKLFLKVYDLGENCLRYFWLDYVITNGFLFLLGIRATRLLFIFNITKSRLENSEKHRWWLDVKYYQESFIRKFLLCFYLCLFVVPVIVNIYVASTSMNGDSSFCKLPWPSVLKYTFLGLAIFLIILIAIQLRKVHDGFYLKNEFRLLAALGFFIVIPLVIVFDGILPDYHRESSLIYMGGFLIILGISYVTPLYKAYKNYYIERVSSGVSSSEKTSIPASSSDQEIELLTFTDFPKISKIMSDSEVLVYLNSYILHFQEVEMSDILAFWAQLRDFRRIEQKEFLAGKAYLLFQKYLKQDGYRYINCDTSDEELAKIEQQINESMAENGASLNSSIFEPIMKNLEAKMAHRLFPSFLGSKFYDEYKEATRLKNNLESVITNK